MIFMLNLVLLEKVAIFLLEHEAWKLFMTETFFHSPSANNKSTATLICDSGALTGIWNIDN